MTHKQQIELQAKLVLGCLFLAVCALLGLVVYVALTVQG